MSMKLMAGAMEIKVGNPIRKLVLLKLCDNANDKGECWPSFQYIAEQCEVSKRCVINHVQALTESGYILVIKRGNEGRQTSNLYIISLKKKFEAGVNDVHPSRKKSASVGVNDMHPSSEKAVLLGVNDLHPTGEPSAPLGVNEMHPPSEPYAPLRGEPDAPEPVTLLNQSFNLNKYIGNLDFSKWPAMPKNQTLLDWFEMRKRSKANVSQTVIDNFSKELNLAVRNGFSVDDCLAEAVTRNWRGFKFEWMTGSNGSSANKIGFRKTSERSLAQDLTDRTWAER